MTKHIGFFILLCAASAWANTFETFGMGPRAEAMAGAVVAKADDFSAAFYNPALLVRQKRANAGANFSFHGLQGSVKSLDTSRTLDCSYCQAPASMGLTSGFVLPLGAKLKDKVSLGTAIYFPVSSLVQVQAADVSTPFWLLQQSNPERFMLFSGVGIKLMDTLTLGAGVQIFADLVGDGAKVTIDIFERQVSSRSLNSKVTLRMSPTAGVYWRPAEGLHVGVSYRAAIYMDYRIPATIDIKDLAGIQFAVSGTAHYSPHTVTAGLAWDLSEKLTLTLDGQWMNWSAAPTPYASLVVDIGGKTLEALGLGSGLDVATAPQAPGFKDTLNGRLGLEYRAHEKFAVRGGVLYRATPVPRQDVPGTNILDGNLLSGSFGLTLGFDDPLALFEHPLFLDLGGQYGYVFERKAQKESTDEVPPYSYSAVAWGGSVALRYDY